MNTKNSYHTKQQETVLNFFKENKENQFTADEAAKLLENKNVGKSSVYRIVSKLCENGVLKRFLGGKGKGAKYQFVGECGSCEEHFHLKCLKCGKLVHLENELSDTVLSLMQAHDFEVSEELTMLVGKCSNCKNS